MSVREQIMASLMEALGTVDGVQLVERNRTSRLPDGLTPALVMFDGDLDGATDRPHAANRNLTFPMTAEAEIYGYVEASDANVGAARDELFSATVKAVWTHMPLRQLLAANDGGLSMDGAAFPPPASAPDTAAAIFVMRLRLPYVFDPKNP